MAAEEWTDALAADLRKLQERAEQMQPAWRASGEAIREFVEQRFQSSTAPDGAPWAELSEEWAKRRKPAKILIQDRRLANSIKFRADHDGVAFGHSVDYGDTHQFGDDNRNIPARPFFPVLPDGTTAFPEGTPAGELYNEIADTILDWLDVLDERGRARAMGG